MNDDELQTGNDQADRLLHQLHGLGEGPAPIPGAELSRLLAGHRRSPRRLWLVGGVSAIVLAGGVGTGAAAAHGLTRPWFAAIHGIGHLWADEPADAATPTARTPAPPARAERRRSGAETASTDAGDGSDAHGATATAKPTGAGHTAAPVPAAGGAPDPGDDGGDQASPPSSHDAPDPVESDAPDATSPDDHHGGGDGGSGKDAADGNGADTPDTDTPDD